MGQKNSGNLGESDDSFDELDKLSNELDDAYGGNVNDDDQGDADLAGRGSDSDDSDFDDDQDADIEDRVPGKTGDPEDDEEAEDEEEQDPEGDSSEEDADSEENAGQDEAEEQDSDSEVEEYIEPSPEDLDVKFWDSKRGEAVSLKQLFAERVSRNEWRPKVAQYKEEIRKEYEAEYGPKIKLAAEREQIERDFTTLPVEYVLKAAQQAVQLGIAPPQFAALVEQSVKKLEEHGLYDRKTALANAQIQMQRLQSQAQAKEASQAKAKAWFDVENFKFEKRFNVSYEDLPDREKKLLRAAFGAADGTPSLVELYEDLFGRAPLAKKKATGGPRNKKAPAATTSRRKLLRLMKKTKRSDVRGRGGLPNGKNSKGGDSLDSLSKAFDRAYSGPGRR